MGLGPKGQRFVAHFEIKQMLLKLVNSVTGDLTEVLDSVFMEPLKKISNLITIVRYRSFGIMMDHKRVLELFLGLLGGHKKHSAISGQAVTGPPFSFR
jgi:hypothetical protein